MAQHNNPLNLKDRLVLIADDNIITLQLLETFLEKEGLKHISCNNGAAALSLAKEKLPDLILLDITMPHLDGFETCRLLKNNQLTKNIPVIFLTSEVEIYNKRKGCDSWSVDYIIKPFEKKEVMVRIKSMLEQKRAFDKTADKELQSVFSNEEIKEQSLIEQQI